MSSDLDAHLSAQLEALRAQQRFRDPNDAHARAEVHARSAEAGRPFLDASSNDYLGLGSASASVSRETETGAGASAGAAMDAGPSAPRPGAGASRLVQGTWPEHEQLEHDLADWVGLPSTLLFSSGYAANLGTLAALVDKGGVVISDELNHASIIDGCRLSRGQTLVIPHLDLAALDAALARSVDAATRWVVTESYFSMDGDGPDLRAVRALCDRHRAFLLVDEAHALGLYGADGAGRCVEAGVQADALIGTLGKSVGSQGAFVGGSLLLRAFLWNRARSFVFSTAPSPELCARARLHVKAARAGTEVRERVLAHAARLRTLLSEHSLPVVQSSFGPILAVLVGSSARALALAGALRDEGVLAQAIRAPTVPEGRARIRVTVTAAAADSDIERLGQLLIQCWRSACPE